MMAKIEEINPSGNYIILEEPIKPSFPYQSIIPEWTENLTDSTEPIDVEQLWEVYDVN